MKVRHLIEELSKQDQNAEVVTYIDEAEEYGNVNKVEFIKRQSDLYYAKGDQPKLKDKPYEGKVVLIYGDITI
jgi:hypothetical protein